MGVSGAPCTPSNAKTYARGFPPEDRGLNITDIAEAVGDKEAMQWTHRLMKVEGIFAGISSGAAMAAAERITSLPENAGKMIVAILPDSAERYLSSALFDDAFTEIEA